MVITFTYIIFLCAAILILTVVIFRIAHSNSAIGSSSHNGRKIYIRQIINLLQEDNPATVRISASTRSQRTALCEAIYLVMSHTYGNNPSSLTSTVEENNLEKFLLRQVVLSRSYTRAHWLMIMSCIPLKSTTSNRIERFIYSPNHAVRIAALTALLAADPQMAIKRIGALQYHLQPIDFNRIISLLRRGILPIAYEPLLESDNYNLQMLGMAIVRNFGIDIADRRLHEIIAKSDDHHIVREAILTLSSLGRPLGRLKIRQRMEIMDCAERKAFCRHLAAEGYSIQALRTIFTTAETLYAETLIKSYKRELGCQQYT